MGRIQYNTVGNGMTEAEALRNAEDEAREYNGHQEGYSGSILSSTEMKSKCIQQPKPAKRCQVEKDVQKGARKWETVFVIEPKWGFSGAYRREEHAVVKTTQGDAIKKAKDMALLFSKEFEITIDKQLANGDNKIATVSPNKAVIGKWKFWGWARS